MGAGGGGGAGSGIWVCFVKFVWGPVAEGERRRGAGAGVGIWVCFVKFVWGPETQDARRFGVGLGVRIWVCFVKSVWGLAAESERRRGARPGVRIWVCFVNFAFWRRGPPAAGRPQRDTALIVCRGEGPEEARTGWMIVNAGEKSRGGWETGREGRMTKYEIVLYGSDADGAFIAELPEPAGCAGDGFTRHEALANVETAIAEWLETARKLGRPFPEAKGRLLST